jgi:hypothetical protein
MNNVTRSGAGKINHDGKCVTDLSGTARRGELKE